MPLVRIAVAKGTPADIKRNLSNAVHDALVEAFNVPPTDRFHLISEYSADELICTPEYLGVVHTDNVVIIQITANEGRTLDMKKALYHRIATLVEANTDILASDVIIGLVEVKKENWSFGNGLAQYALQ